MLATALLQVSPEEVQAFRQELAGQITHPIEEYLPGSARLERLYAAMDEASRFAWPPEGFMVNL